MESIDVCIAFMHKKIRGIFRHLIKNIKMIGVSLELMEMK
jgi:hypothetical protein